MTGSIVTFDDAIPFMPIEKIVASIEPQQDLHGYDAPWAAGGGANQWDEDWEVGDISSATGQNEGNDSLIRSKNYIPITGGSAYYAKVGTVTGNLRARFYDSSKTYIGYEDKSGAIVQCNASFTAPDNASYMRFAVPSGYGNTYHNDISINYPSTVTTYSPYSNECPISGWTGLSGERDGKNLFDQSQLLTATGWSVDSSGVYSGTRGNFHNAFNGGFPELPPFKENTQYTFSLKARQGEASSWSRLAFKYTDGTTSYIANITGTSEEKFTATSLSGRTIQTITGTYGSLQNVILYLSEMQLEEGSTATTYEPYTSLPITCTWLTEAGTVYGGTVDVVTGVLTVEWKTVTIDGTGGNGASLNNNIRVRYPIPDDSVVWSDGSTKSGYVICNMFPEGTNAESGTGTVCFHLRANGSHEVMFGFGSSFPGVSTLAEAMEWITANKPVVCYKLAEPVVYQLTPQQIETLIGNNTVFVDTGDVTVTYQSTSGSTPVRTSLKSPLKSYSYNALKLFGNTFIEHGKG